MSDHTRIPVLYLAPWVGFGGSDKGTIDWFRWLDRSRFAPSLITTQPDANGRLAEVVPYAEEVWPLPDLMSGDRFAAFIVDFIVSRRVGVVHIMNSRIGFDLLLDLRMLDRPPKLVVQLHVEEPTCDGYVRYVTTRYGNLVDAFSVSSEVLAAPVQAYGIPRDRIVVIPTGVDAESEFCPDLAVPRAGIDTGVINILYPGRLVEQKDPMMMVEVARELDARGLDFCIHVVGNGALKPAVRERVRAYRLEQRVLFEPATSDLVPWYAAADLVLMTSVFEGVPYVIYEALAMAVPVVAPALPGNTELMSGVGGVLVDHRDRPSAYAEALEPLMRDRELRACVGAAGRQRVRERLSVREMANRHGQLYDRLCAERPARDAEPEPGAPPRISFLTRPSRGAPLVSIVTPCFNHGRWLRECVASVRAQTYPQLEMIVVDDGSTEAETLTYLAELTDAPDVRLERMPQNCGPSAARNRGLEHADGRYILPLDADNVLLPDAVALLVEQIQGAGAHVGYIYQNIQYFGNREDYFEPPAFNVWLLTRQNFVDTCALIDREVFDNRLRYPEDIVFGHEDWDFFLTLAAHGIFGEPARTKTLRYRKHGVTRSDLVEWSGSPFRDQLAARHPTMLAARGQNRGDNPHVRLKARWAPALTLITLAPVTVAGPIWETVLRSVRRQSLRDFEVFTATDRAPPATPDLPPLRMLPPRLQTQPSQALAHALDLSGARNVIVTAGSGAEMLADPGSLERVVRLLEDRPSPDALAFAAAAGPGRYPFSLLPGDDPVADLHSIAWSRRHEALRAGPHMLDGGDPVGGLGRWFQLNRFHVEWRHVPSRSSVRDPQPDSRFARVARPRPPRAEAAELAARLDAEPLLPGTLTPIARWRAISNWRPPSTAPLVRHRRVGSQEWTINTSFNSPPGSQAEHYLGVVHVSALAGTGRLVRDPESGYAVVPVGSEPGADEMAGTLGYPEQVAFPLLEPLILCRHASTGEPVLLCGDDDPLRDNVDSPPLAVLGWLDRLPVNPRIVPGARESTAWLRGLVRGVDTVARRHRVALGSAPLAGPAWELGALLDRDPGNGIPAWVDAAGRLHTREYAPTRPPFDPGRTLRWIAAPATWRGFGRHAPRARAIGRRSFDALRYALVRPGLAAATPAGDAPQAWLLREPGRDRVPIFSSVHAATADQLVTRDPSEARELGYDSIRVLGYALALAPVTGNLARPRMAVPWGSRFGEALTRAEDPHPASA